MHKRSIGRLFVFSTLVVLSLNSCNSGGNTPSKPEREGVTIYRPDSYYLPTYFGQMPLKFYDEDKQIPYVDVDYYVNYFLTGAYSCSKSGNTFTFTNNIWKSTYPTNSKATFNVDTNVLTFNDFNAFVNLSGGANPLDTVGENDSFVVVSNSYINKAKTTIELDTYNIKSYSDSSALYLPLYTVQSIFFNNTYYNSVFYNGDALYIESELDFNKDSYYQYNKTIRNTMKLNPTENYLTYARNQLAFDLDLRYGMNQYSRTLRKDNSTFNYGGGLPGKSLDLLPSESVMTTSAKNFDIQTFNYFANSLDDGGHTGIYNKGFFGSRTKALLGNESIYISNCYTSIYDMRATKSYQGVLKNYPSVYLLSFNNFLDESIIKNLANDINNNQNITHLIIDLSCNGGGYIDVEEKLAYYITRGNNYSCAKSSVNGAESKIKYKVDVNGDGTFGGTADKLRSGITVDVIVSNYSFSAANSFICNSRYYDSTIHIHGENSGGGVCCIDSKITPTGLPYYHSGYIRLGYIDNSSFVDIDQGTSGCFGDIYEKKWSHSTEASSFSNYSSLADYITKR